MCITNFLHIFAENLLRMDRITFCKMLAIAKKHSKVTTSDICFAMHKLPTDVRRIERGLFNFRMDRCIEYLSVIGHCLYMEALRGTEYCRLRSYQDIVDWLSRLMEGQSYPKINDAIGFSRGYLRSLAEGKAVMSIDKFLAIAEYFHYSVKLCKANAKEGV